MTISPDNLQATHLAIWNERDRTKRDALIAQIYAADIVMNDPDAVFSGRQAISDFIDKVQTQDPEFYFSATRPIQQVQNGMRLHWNIQFKKDQPGLTGIDFFILDEGMIKELYVFMDLNK